jgi:transposase
VNTLRALLRELGIVIPMGIEKVIPQVRCLVADADSGIPDSLRSTIAAACDEIESLTKRIRHAERDIDALAEQTPVVPHLRSIPGIGLMTSTALVAFVMDIQRFPSGRHSRATSVLPHGSTRAASGDGSAASRSEGTHTCACC